MRILVVEDDLKMASLLRRALEREGYTVEVASSGSEALWAIETTTPDAVVLDAMIPPPDGFEVCRTMRSNGCWAPVLMLTARDAVADRVAGLDAGADDYLVKPLALAELFARLRALLRRDPVERPQVLEVAGIRLDPAAKVVSRAGREVSLSAREFSLLELFVRRPDEVLSRSDILDHVWDVAYSGGSNVVDVYVRYLREKIDRPFGAASLETVRGHGYRLRSVAR